MALMIPKTESFASENKDKVERLIHLLKTGAISPSDKYLRWEQLSREVPPEYLVPREWWLALKLQRILGRHDVGLKDSRGEPFTLGSVEFFAEAIHGLDRVGQTTKGEGEASARDLLDQLSVQALREEAIATTQLDGLEVDQEQARELLGSGRRPSNPSEQAVLNAYRVLERIREIRAQPLTLALLADLHQRLTAGTSTKADLSGRLRQVGTSAAPVELADNHPSEPQESPPPAELPARLKAMLAFANGRAPEHFVHPLLRAAALHYWVLHDQPFAEGNGRLARALYYWGVLHAGYPVFETLSLSAVFQDAPTAYQRAFAEVGADENDLMHFAAHIFDAIAKAQRHGRDEARRLEGELRETESLSEAMNEFNDRQRLLVARALKEPCFRRTLQEHARDHNLVRQTARNDFAPLVKLGWFEEAKIGKALAFFPAPDLAQRVK